MFPTWPHGRGSYSHAIICAKALSHHPFPSLESIDHQMFTENTNVTGKGAEKILGSEESPECDKRVEARCYFGERQIGYMESIITDFDMRIDIYNVISDLK